MNDFTKKLKFRVEELDPGFDVQTVPEMNWAGEKDGPLLAKAKKHFDVFITSDRNLSFQQPIQDSELQALSPAAHLPGRYRALIKPENYLYFISNS